MLWRLYVGVFTLREQYPLTIIQLRTDGAEGLETMVGGVVTMHVAGEHAHCSG